MIKLDNKKILITGSNGLISSNLISYLNNKNLITFHTSQNKNNSPIYFDLDNKTNFTTYSVLCSPLIAANECIGVIQCLNKKTNNKLFTQTILIFHI